MSNSPFPTSESLQAHRTKTKKEYYQFFADGPEDAARILHVVDDGEGDAKAFPGKDGYVWFLVDKAHELYLKMDPELASVLGAQLLLGAGVAEVIRSRRIDTAKPKEPHVSQSTEAVEGSGNPQPGD